MCIAVFGHFLNRVGSYCSSLCLLLTFFRLSYTQKDGRIHQKNLYLADLYSPSFGASQSLDRKVGPEHCTLLVFGAFDSFVGSGGHSRGKLVRQRRTLAIHCSTLVLLRREALGSHKRRVQPAILISFSSTLALLALLAFCLVLGLVTVVGHQGQDSGFPFIELWKSLPPHVSLGLTQTS